MHIYIWSTQTRTTDEGVYAYLYQTTMSICCSYLRNEFRLKKFWLSDVHSARFATFQWRLPPIVYLLYRLVIAVYADFWLIYTAVEYGSVAPGNGLYAWPVYLTNWTYTMLCLYLTLHALTTLFFLCTSPAILWWRRLPVSQHCALFTELEVHPSLWGDDYEPIPSHDNEDGELTYGETSTRSNLMPFYFKLVWVLLNIMSSCSVMVTLIFFIFLWPQMNTDNQPIDLGNLQLHGINSVIVFLECLLTAAPVHLLHFVFPLTYGIVYLVFTAIFYGAGNKDPIYPEVLDWNSDKVGQTMIMVLVVGFVILPLLQVFFFIIYRLKLWLYGWISSRSSD
ncbi:protein rolling stone-like [Mizuhopecten yessoensis]|uniref:protein rolling stone-like n=1 Tax=Mizuhopecten yessoensis TaxID=6573 RepID=UPI000B45E8A1|nr:protein rolling stone-like [Mizuhopecten yessoensis]